MFDRMRQWLAGRIYGGEHGPTDDFWYNPIDGSISAAGIPITPTTAQRQAIVATCVRVLSESLAYLPAFVFKRLPDGGREVVRGHRLAPIVSNRPNVWQTGFEFREQMMGWLNYRGNSFSLIKPGAAGSVDQLIPLHPQYMKDVEQLPSGMLRYTWDNPQDKVNSGVYSQDQILHVRNSTDDGIVGISPIKNGANTIGVAIAAETHAANVLRNGVRSPYGIKLPHTFDDEAARNFAKAWSKDFGGFRNADKAPIFEQGSEPVNLGMTLEDAQLLETRKLQRSEIAGLFRVPAHMINDLGDATFSNVTELGIQFTTYSLGPWLVRIRQAIENSLFTEEERETFFVDFVLDAFVRGDIEKRFKSYALALDRWMTSNEIRKLENLNPLDDGDTLKEPAGGRGANQVPSQNPAESDPNADPNTGSNNNGQSADIRRNAIARAAAANGESVVLSRDITGDVGG